MPHPRYKQVPTTPLEINHTGSSNKADDDGIVSLASTYCAGRYVKAFLVLLVVLPVPLLFYFMSSGDDLILDASVSTSKRGSASSSSSKISLDPSPSLVENALKFVAGREQAWKQAGNHKHWKLRGHGYLHTYLNISLAAKVIPSSSSTDNTMTMGQNRVVIWNVHPQRSKPFDDCHLLSLWVRVNGPEIMAGKARPVSAHDSPIDDCLWDFWVDIQIPSKSYHVDAKVILWNGNAPILLYGKQDPNHPFLFERQCPETTEGSNELSAAALQEAPKMTSIMGFKLYQQIGACCEICRRTPHCLYWATPPKSMPAPSAKQNGCDLYFPDDTPDDAIPTSRVWDDVTRNQLEMLQKDEAEGRPAPKAVDSAWGPSFERGNPNLHPENKSAHFVGCGWNYEFTVEFPCLDGNLDDDIYMEQRDFEVASDTSVGPVKTETFPLLCGQEDELFVNMLHKTNPPQQSTTPTLTGRWVREPWPTANQCPKPMEYQFIERDSFSVETFDGTRPQCWHRSNLAELSTQCTEFNCDYIERSHRWETTPLKHDTQFMAIWKNYKCKYMEFTDAQLNECLMKRKISKLILWGQSIARTLRHYFNIRIENLTFYTEADGIEVIVHSAQWAHLLWHNNETEYLASLKKNPPANRANQEAYVVSPYLVSSEREPYIFLDRVIRFGEVTEAFFAPRGYKMINGFDISAAFTYDTATQSDGLHIVGPPAKMIVMKVLHHMCADVVEGTVL